MTVPRPWTVVAHTADESPPSAALPHLLRWLDDQPEVELCSVLWSAGHVGTEPFRHGTFVDVGTAHEGAVATALRGLGLHRPAGAIAGRAVRAALRRVPRHGVLYLSSARSAPVLRHLPAGERTVVTHLHAIDRSEDHPIPPERLDVLRRITDIWLVSDEDTRRWATQEWGIGAEELHVVPPFGDQASWRRSVRLSDPNRLRLALRGSTWFRTDHAGRLVQLLQRLRPQLGVELIWAEVQPDLRQIGPVLHDLRTLGVGDALEVPATAEELTTLLGDVDVIALTTPDGDDWWVVAEGSGLEVPLVCFETHRCADLVAQHGGTVLAYPEVASMASAVLDHLATAREAGDEDVELQRRNRSIEAMGPRLLQMVEGVER